ncbi:unnamed protein product [Leptidea sinapis]|uniref:Uncharacterized protein n=1 Tax=Leptidea sinapis TaxID=189913 RepID=A0A5E4QAX6_9NEOP|nr:unnamed protein product [Leptidea sinapis]
MEYLYFMFAVVVFVSGEMSQNKLDIINVVKLLNSPQESGGDDRGSTEAFDDSNEKEIKLKKIMSLLQNNFDANLDQGKMPFNPESGARLHLISNPQEIQEYRAHLKKKGVKLGIPEYSNDEETSLKDRLQSLRRNAVFRLGRHLRERNDDSINALRDGLPQSIEKSMKGKSATIYSDNSNEKPRKKQKEVKKKGREYSSSENKSKKLRKKNTYDMKENISGKRNKEYRDRSQSKYTKAEKWSREDIKKEKFSVKKNKGTDRYSEEIRRKKSKKILRDETMENKKYVEKKVEIKRVEPKKNYFKPVVNNWEKPKIKHYNERPGGRSGNELWNVRTSIPFIGKRGIYENERGN